MDETQLERWRAAVGANAGYYLPRFKRIGEAGGWAPGWNTAAFLHSTGWFWYRRMFGWAGLNLLAPFALLFVLAAAASVSPGANLDSLASILGLLYVVGVFVLIPIVADSIYYRRLSKVVNEKGTAPPAPSAWTLAGAIALGVLWLWLMAMTVSPMYADYTPRAKVSEAILAASSTRNELSEFFEKERRLPGPTEASRFRADRPSKYVEHAVYEPGGSRIVVTMREVQPGKRFALYATVKDGTLDWSCRTIDIEARYLPSICRN